MRVAATVHSRLGKHLSTEQEDSPEPTARNTGNWEVYSGTVSRKTDRQEVTEEHFDGSSTKTTPPTGGEISLDTWTGHSSTKNYPANWRGNQFGHLDGAPSLPF